MTPEEIATDFYIEFNTVCQGDDTLPHDVAKWVLKWLGTQRIEENAKLVEELTAAKNYGTLADEEVERLREALGEIIDQCDKGLAHVWIKGVARAALQSKGEK